MNRSDMISKADLLAAIEEIGLGQIFVRLGDRDGVVLDGYLNLTELAQKLNRLSAVRRRAASEQAR